MYPLLPSMFLILLTSPSVCKKNFGKNFSVNIDNLLTIVIFIIKSNMKEETKKKISYKLRGRKKSANHKKRIAQAMRKVKRGEAHNKAISEAMKIIWKKRKEVGYEGKEI